MNTTQDKTVLLHVPRSLHKTIGDRALPVVPESLEHAITSDHVLAVTADFQVCIEDRLFHSGLQLRMSLSSVDKVLSIK